MQLIEGQPLATFYTVMSREQKVRLMQQVADAIHAAHRLGIIHRDIKPGNITSVGAAQQFVRVPSQDLRTKSCFHAAADGGRRGLSTRMQRKRRRVRRALCVASQAGCCALRGGA